MDPRAIAKAESRLRVCRKALEELYCSGDFQAFSDTWYTFLTAAKNIYNAIEQGSKITPQSRQWYGAKKQERKDDELLQYIFEARNDDEHGLSQVLRPEPPAFLGGVNHPGFSRSMRIDGDTINGFRFTSLDGKPVLSEHRPERGALVPISARGRPSIAPPATHLGEPIHDPSPEVVAGLAIEYLEALIEQAKGLI